MIDINIMINHEMMRERLLARSELAGEIFTYNWYAKNINGVHRKGWRGTGKAF